MDTDQFDSKILEFEIKRTSSVTITESHNDINIAVFHNTDQDNKRIIELIDPAGTDVTIPASEVAKWPYVLNWDGTWEYADPSSCTVMEYTFTTDDLTADATSISDGNILIDSFSGEILYRTSVPVDSAGYKMGYTCMEGG